MSTPIDFLIENQSIILKTHSFHEGVIKNTWAKLQKKLPKLSETMKYNTFKQYLPVFIVFINKILFYSKVEN